MVKKIIDEFTMYLEAKGYKPRGIQEKLSAVKSFIAYTETERLTYRVFSLEAARSYREYLRLALNDNGTLRFTPATINGRIAYLRLFYKYLVAHGTVLSNPFLNLEKMREHTSLPKTVLTVEQMKTILENVPLQTELDLRFALILDLLYSGGFRISEIEKLQSEDINSFAGTVIIRDDKARRDRVVPLTEYASQFLNFFLEYIQTENKEQPFLYGKERSLNRWVNKRLKKLCSALNLPVISAHCIRHTVATHLLQNNAELREVQELLGHVKIRHTERYTHLFTDDLQDVITESHPREQEAVKHADVSVAI